MGFLYHLLAHLPNYVPQLDYRHLEGKDGIFSANINLRVWGPQSSAAYFPDVVPGGRSPEGCTEDLSQKVNTWKYSYSYTAV